MAQTNVQAFPGDVTIHEYIKHIGDENNLFGFSGTDTFKIATAGVDAIKVDANQNIDITGVIRHIGDENNLFGFSGTDTFKIATAGTDRLTVKADGTVGIGTATPAYTLDINGTTQFRAGQLIRSVLSNSVARPALTDTLQQYEIRASAGNPDVNLGSGHGFLRIGAGGAMASGNYISYIDLTGYSANADMNRNIVFGTSSAERMRIKDNGNVGIGTNAPESILHLSASTASADITDPIKIKIHNRANASDWSITQPWGLLEFDTDDASTAGNGPVAGIGCRAESSYGGDTSLCFYTDDVADNDNVLGSANERMCINSDGLVGVGTAAPRAKMDIYTGSTTAAGIILDRYGSGNYRSELYQAADGLSIHVGNASTTPSQKLLIGHNGTVTATTFSGALDGNADTATTLATNRAINGVDFNGSAGITVEPYISNDNTGITSCYLTFTTNTTQGYKRLYEDSGLVYDNTNNKLTTTTFSGALDGNADTATTLADIRTINGVNFDGSGNITVEPYISNDNTGDPTCYLTFTATSTAGYKRLYEDDGLIYDNTNNILYTARGTFNQYVTGGGGNNTMASFQIQIRQTNNVNYYQSIGYIDAGCHDIKFTATPSGDSTFSNTNFTMMVNKGRYGPADLTHSTVNEKFRYDSSLGYYPQILWYGQNNGQHGRITLYICLYNAGANQNTFYFNVSASGTASGTLTKSYTNQW